LEGQPKNEKANMEIEGLQKDIRDAESTIGHLKNQNNNDNKQSNLVKENRELKQQLAEVQKQLAEVLAELKKLKGNTDGKGTEKLDQQIVQNEKLMKNGEKVSMEEVKEQVQKSQVLLKEASTSVSTGSATASPVKGNENNIGSGPLPYVIGGSVIVGSILMIGYLAKRKKEK